MGSLKCGDVRPGQFLAAMDPQPEKKGALFLPDVRQRDLTGGNYRAMRNLRADAATVLKLGPIPEPRHPQYRLAVKMHESLTVGDHVLLVPYLNRFAELGQVEDAHIAGLDGDEWLDTTIAKEVDGNWVMLGNWILMRLHWTRKPVAANNGGQFKRTFEDWGKVLACGTDSQFEACDEIMVVGKSEVRPYDCKFFVSPQSPWGDDVVMFREESWQMGRNRRLELVNRVGAVA
jgi:hypothetical protein